MRIYIIALRAISFFVFLSSEADGQRRMFLLFLSPQKQNSKPLCLFCPSLFIRIYIIALRAPSLVIICNFGISSVCSNSNNRVPCFSLSLPRALKTYTEKHMFLSFWTSVSKYCEPPHSLSLLCHQNGAANRAMFVAFSLLCSEGMHPVLRLQNMELLLKITHNKVMFPSFSASVSKLDSQPRMSLSFSIFKTQFKTFHIYGVFSSLDM
jgi:hypothetical protein